MKRLMISGFGCPRDPWLEFLGPDTRVITLHEVLEATRSPQIADWGLYVAGEIKSFRPSSIIAHDFGGTTTLTALMNLQEQGTRMSARLTIMNTAFRDFDVLKNPHPFLMQVAPWRLTTQLIQASGGEVDPALEPWYPTIRAVYRRVIASSFARKVQLKIQPRKKAEPPALDYDLGLPAQIIASTNDPYTSLESLRRIQDDFMIPDFYEVEYGHFPYAARGREAVQDLIHNFEATPRALHAKRKK